MEKLRIAHIGFGWLAGHLQKSWGQRFPKWDLRYFNRSEKIGCETFELGLDQKTPSALNEADLLIITLSPKSDLEGYKRAIFEITKHWTKEKPLIYFSTTSLFPQKTFTFTERTLFVPDSAKGKMLLEVEDYLISNFECVTIIRSAGQIGPGRNPALSLSKSQRQIQGDTPVNLIHLEDIKGLLESIITQGKFPQILHAVSPLHPSKKEFYTTLAKNSGVELAPFLQDDNTQRIISSIVIDQLNYEFVKPDCQP